MGQGPIASSNWGLGLGHDKTVQGLVVSAFEDLNASVALFLELPTPFAGGEWLARLLKVAPVTNAERPPAGAGSHAPSVALAFTCTGLRAIGVADECLATFSVPFQEGMRQIDRQRRLGDETGHIAVLPGGPRWSGNAPDSDALVPIESTPTPDTVHAALLLYHRTWKDLSGLEKAVKKVLRGFKVRVVRRIEMRLRNRQREVREHFGFVDGISQPIPYGAAIITADGSPRPPDPFHGVAAGDILIGHQDANIEPAPGPFASDRAPGAKKWLPRGHAPHGSRDLGLDGSYLVIRELRQDVGAFWESMKTATKALGGAYDDKWLAARVVGRTLDGDPLCPDGVLDKDGDKPANAFSYRHTDAFGLGCPLGSHIRRANPRDGLAPTPQEAKLFLHASNNHRILRRGRKFGPTYREGERPQERGLLFMAFNTDIARQFEFIQQTWMLNKNFAVLHDETDPLVGAKGKFTVPLTPLRARVDVRTFVRLAGGEYFFLPSLPALDFLAHLPS